jgi:hypothetical protein
LHKKPSGCGASVASAAGPFSTGPPSKKKKKKTQFYIHCIYVLFYTHVYWYSQLSTRNQKEKLICSYKSLTPLLSWCMLTIHSTASRSRSYHEPKRHCLGSSHNLGHDSTR